MKLLILVVDDKPDVELLFGQQFRHDLRVGRFTREFAQSGDSALKRLVEAQGASIILILSDVNMPGMTGLELLPKAKAARPDVPIIVGRFSAIMTAIRLRYVDHFCDRHRRISDEAKDRASRFPACRGQKLSWLHIRQRLQGHRL